MPYQLEWKPEGVIARFSGVLDFRVNVDAENEIFADPRAKDLRYVVWDVRDVSGSSLDEADLARLAAQDAVGSALVGALRFALLIGDPGLREFCDTYVRLSSAEAPGWSYLVSESVEEVDLWVASPPCEAPRRQSAPEGTASLEDFAGVDDIIYCYQLEDPIGFTYVSPAATRIVGYTPEEHYANPQLGMKIVHPDDRDTLEGIIQSVLTTGHARTRLRWIHKNGETVWTEQVNTAIRDASGRCTALVGIARDVTTQKGVDAEREETIRQLRAALGEVETLAQAQPDLSSGS